MPASAAPVPLAPGLVISSTVSQAGVDYEGTARLEKLDADGALFVVDRAVNDLNLASRRLVRNEDLTSATRLYNCMFTGDPGLFPGSTFIQLASARSPRSAPARR